VDPKIRTAEELGSRLRAERKSRGLTLAETAGLANTSIKFLSEFERGKPTAEIGKVLKVLAIVGLDVLVQSRHQSDSSSTEAPDDKDASVQQDS